MAVWSSAVSFTTFYQCNNLYNFVKVVFVVYVNKHVFIVIIVNIQWRNKYKMTRNDKKKPELLCRYCSRVFKSKKSFTKHEEAHENEQKPVKCEVCNQEFSNNMEYEKHQFESPEEYPFSCGICFKRFLKDTDRAFHEGKHKKRKKRCKLCKDTSFDTEDEYLTHVKDVHDGKVEDYYICSECGKQMKTSSELLHHVRSKCGTIRRFKCHICGIDLMTAGSHYHHMLIHKGVKSFMCRFCAKQFLTRGQLQVHERIHTQDKAFVCTVCGKGFCHRQSLITHSTLHTGIKPYQCENCGNSFSCVGNLLKHRKTHADTCGKIPLTTHRVLNPATKLKLMINTPETVKLSKKQKIIQDKIKNLSEKLKSTSTQLNQDEVNANDNAAITDLNLKVTDYQSSPESNLETQSAVETVPNNSDNTSVNNKLVASNMKIESYDEDNNFEVFNDYEDFDNEPTEEMPNLNNKIENVEVAVELSIIKQEMIDASQSLASTEQESDDNDIMSKKSAKKRKVSKNHMVSTEKVTHYVQNRGLEGSKSKLVCKYCGKSYNLPKCLLKHEKDHERTSSKFDATDSNGSKPYLCSCCKATFTSKDECVKHQNAEHSDQLTCKECLKIFSNPQSLRTHNSIFHLGQSKKSYLYVCDKCGMQFKQKASLKYHGENNCSVGPQFECEICGKKFCSTYNRKTHMVVHSNEKKLSCKFCQKTFHWKGQLKIHERTHTGEKPFNCLYCPKKFPYRESLITHSSIHTGIKPHLCKACGFRFSCIGNLIKHRNTHAATCGLWYSKNDN